MQYKKTEKKSLSNEEVFNFFRRSSLKDLEIFICQMH